MSVEELSINLEWAGTFHIADHMKKSIQIELDKQYQFPMDLEVKILDGKYLVISPNTGNWIVLDNGNQFAFFQYLLKYSVSESIHLFEGNRRDCEKVLVQIEGKQFDKNVINFSVDEKPSLHFYLTNVCNLLCPHCYMNAGAPLENELDTNEVFKILDDFSQYGGCSVTFTGGEVTTRKDFVDIVHEASKCGLEIKILSNGTLWRQEMIDSVASMVSSIQFSIDGYDEKSHDAIRGKNSFARTMKTIDRFVAKGVQVDVAVTPPYDDKLCDRIKEYSDFALSLTNKYEGEKFVIRFSSELLDGRNVTLNDNQRKEYKQIIDKIYCAYYNEDVSDYPFIARFREKRVLENCMFGNLSISSNGNVYLCSRIPSVSPIGNVRNMPFEEIMFMAHKARDLSNINNLRPCNKCELKYICGGGCRIDYFPSLALCNDICSLDSDSISERLCWPSTKDEFYKMMIRTNDKIIL